MKKITLFLTLSLFLLSSFAYAQTGTTKTNVKKAAIKATAKTTKPAAKKVSAKPAVPKASGSQVKPAAASSSTSTVFTAQTLKKYNGQNGNPAYVAIDGVVYDVTAAWGGGEHNGVSAGTDASSAIGQSPHGKRVLKKLPIVGTYK